MTVKEKPGTSKSLSLRALDILNFAVADIRDGVGPFLAIYLRSALGWDSAAIGIAVAASNFATIIAQSPIGALVDRIHQKRKLTAIAAVVIAIGCLIFISTPNFPMVIAAQLLNGAANTVFAPVIAAISLGLVGQAGMSKRTGRNEAFNHTGNLATALAAGFVSKFFSIKAIFILTIFFTLAAAISALAIRPSDVDYEAARGGIEDESSHPVSIKQLLSDKRILIFIASVVMFHFANAAMLPQVGQKVSDSHIMNPGVCMAACIIVAQFCMIPVALLSSRFASSWGRKPVFLCGFASLPLRAAIFALTANPYVLIAAQILDGIGAGVYGVLAVLVAADLTRGTGRFNFTLGLVATAVGLGATLSNVITGYVVKSAGYGAGFFMLTIISVLALALFAILMPETRSAALPESA